MLEVKNISRYYGEKKALDSVSFTIDTGEAVGFLGINGAGKSTTMNILTGYLSPTEGEVLIDGTDLLTEPMKAKSKIGYLPEQPPVYQEMKVGEYLRFIYDLKKVKKDGNIAKSKKDYLDQIMELVKIFDVKDRLIRNLSKGYRQRVGLAQALVGDPEILILDEPTVGLDPAQIIEMRQLISDLAKSRTILLSSHILSEIQAVCDRIIVLHQGKIVADGKTENLSQGLSGKIEILLESEGKPEIVLEQLKVLKGTDTVEKTGKSSYRIRMNEKFDDGLSVRREISDRLSRTGCNILSLKEKKMSLEDVFLKLTAGESPEMISNKGGKHNDSDL